VGNAVEQAFEPIVQRLNQVEGLQVRMAALRSEYWGQQISVTGLITGQDILRNLKGKDLGDGILLPSLMLKHDDARFLDDMTVNELAEQLGTKIWQIGSIEELLETCANSDS
jgi:NifB/MoaA-like Fe-S oxidoreductase